jgi:hypothetical protein
MAFMHVGMYIVRKLLSGSRRNGRKIWHLKVTKLTNMIKKSHLKVSGTYIHACM